MSKDAIEQSSANSLGRHRPEPPTWDDIGDAFETMGKVGLAMAIGMSAAGFFCRLAQQGKIRVPSLSSLVVGREEPAARGDKPRRKNPGGN